MMSSLLVGTRAEDPWRVDLMGESSELSVKERREAVLSLLRPDEPEVVIARRAGASGASLCRWRGDSLAAGEATVAGGTRNGATTGDRQTAEFEQQIEKRDQGIHGRVRAHK
jgi:hypothetical protein